MPYYVIPITPIESQIIKVVARFDYPIDVRRVHTRIPRNIRDNYSMNDVRRALNSLTQKGILIRKEGEPRQEPTYALANKVRDRDDMLRSISTIWEDTELRISRPLSRRRYNVSDN